MRLASSTPCTCESSRYERFDPQLVSSRIYRKADAHAISLTLSRYYHPYLGRFVLWCCCCQSVGTVTRVQNQAQIGAATAATGTPVHMNDRLRTGANARLEVTFNDDSKLTLGENSNVVVDRYVFNPNKSSAQVVLNATHGAFRFAGGKIEQMNHKNIVVNTPNAALAVRGTHFWAGPIDGKYGVLLLSGKVGVRKR